MFTTTIRCFTVAAIAALMASALPMPSLISRAAFTKQNGLDAQKLNAQFASLKKTDSCDAATMAMACVEGGFAQCVGGKWAVNQCAGGLVCAALPLVNSPGTSLSCDTKADAIARIAASGATGGLTGDGSSSAADSPDAASSASTAATKTSSSDAEVTATATDDPSVVTVTVTATADSCEATDSETDDE